MICPSPESRIRRQEQVSEVSEALAVSAARLAVGLERSVREFVANKLRDNSTPAHIFAKPFRTTLSSRGLGHRPFTAGTRVRIPLGSPIKSAKSQIRPGFKEGVNLNLFP